MQYKKLTKLLNFAWLLLWTETTVIGMNVAITSSSISRIELSLSR